MWSNVTFATEFDFYTKVWLLEKSKGKLKAETKFSSWYQSLFDSLARTTWSLAWSKIPLVFIFFSSP